MATDYSACQMEHCRPLEEATQMSKLAKVSSSGRTERCRETNGHRRRAARALARIWQHLQRGGEQRALISLIPAAVEGGPLQRRSALARPEVQDNVMDL